MEDFSPLPGCKDCRFAGTGSDLFKNEFDRLQSRQRRRTCHWSNHRFSPAIVQANVTHFGNAITDSIPGHYKTDARSKLRKKKKKKEHASLRNENREKGREKKKERRNRIKEIPLHHCCVHVPSNQQKENKLTIKEQQ